LLLINRLIILGYVPDYSVLQQKFLFMILNEKF